MKYRSSSEVVFMDSPFSYESVSVEPDMRIPPPEWKPVPTP